jgi:hypothetical protein
MIQQCEEKRQYLGHKIKKFDVNIHHRLLSVIKHIKANFILGPKTTFSDIRVLLSISGLLKGLQMRAQGFLLKVQNIEMNNVLRMYRKLNQRFLMALKYFYGFFFYQPVLKIFKKLSSWYPPLSLVYFSLCALIHKSTKSLADSAWSKICRVGPYADKKENKIFLIRKEIQVGAVAKSYMRRAF